MWATCQEMPDDLLSEIGSNCRHYGCPSNPTRPGSWAWDAATLTVRLDNRNSSWPAPPKLKTLRAWTEVSCISFPWPYEERYFFRNICGNCQSLVTQTTSWLLVCSQKADDKYHHHCKHYHSLSAHHVPGMSQSTLCVLFHWIFTKTLWR